MRKVQPRLLGALWLLVATLSCSSPTAPTRPPLTGPPVTTPPPSSDQRPLTLTCPATQTVQAASSTGATVTFSAPTSSGGVPPAGGTVLVTTTCSPASGSLFPVGTTTVRCTGTVTGNPSSTASCSFAVTVTPPPPRLAATKFLAFGDSMTAGEVTTPVSGAAASGEPNYRLILVPSASYPTQLLSLLRARYTTQAALLQVTNAGKSGEWAEDGALRLPQVMSASRPDALVLLHGANELIALGAPGVARAARALETMAKEARGRGAVLFLATLPPTRASGTLAIPAAHIQSLNSSIRSIARGENATLVDLHDALSTDVNRYIGIDGVHPTELGYQKIADTVFAAIRGRVEAR